MAYHTTRILAKCNPMAPLYLLSRLILADIQRNSNSVLLTAHSLLATLVDKRPLEEVEDTA